MSHAWTDYESKDFAPAISAEVGAEMRRERAARGIPRAALSERLPSRIGDRALLEIEHGKIIVKVLRLAEISDELGADPADILRRGLQRARVNIANLALNVDLHALVANSKDGAVQFRSLRQWALNALNENPDGVMTVEVAGVRNLALLIGCSRKDLADHLQKFTPPPATARRRN